MSEEHTIGGLNETEQAMLAAYLDGIRTGQALTEDWYEDDLDELESRLETLEDTIPEGEIDESAN